MLFDVDFLHNKRSLSDARSKKISFASVATAKQIILATLPLYSQNATWRSSTANTEHVCVRLSKVDKDSSRIINNVFAPFLIRIIIIKSPKQRLETYCFCSVSYYYYYVSPSNEGRHCFSLIFSSSQRSLSGP